MKIRRKLDLPTLREGDTGPYVRHAQRLLGMEPVPPRPPPGRAADRFCALMTKYVREVRRRAGLPDTGVIDMQVWVLLLDQRPKG